MVGRGWGRWSAAAWPTRISRLRLRSGPGPGPLGGCKARKPSRAGLDRAAAEVLSVCHLAACRRFLAVARARLLRLWARACLPEIQACNGSSLYSWCQPETFSLSFCAQLLGKLTPGGQAGDAAGVNTCRSQTWQQLSHRPGWNPCPGRFPPGGHRSRGGAQRQLAQVGQQAGQLQPRVYAITDAHVAEADLLRRQEGGALG